MVVKGCRNCRRRHLKCTFEHGASTCEKCSELGIQCELGPRFQFKEVKHINEGVGPLRQRYHLNYGTEQVWVHVPKGRGLSIHSITRLTAYTMC